MEWTGEGLLIGVRRHGETSVIAEAMVVGRGRWLGLVRGGRSSKLTASLQPGNSVQLVWRARLEDHLGAFTIELLQARAAALFAERNRLYLAQLLCEHLRLLPERDPHDRLLARALELLDGPIDAMAVVEFELLLLDELGFGLDLTHCAITGATTGLAYVSPRSGRAVSETAAAPYRDRLLALPAFLRDRTEPNAGDLCRAFALTRHFLERHVWAPRNLDPPTTRDVLVERLAAG